MSGYTAKFVDINSPEFESVMINLFQRAFNQAIDRMKTDPFFDYGETMKRKDVAKVLGLSVSQVRTRAISETKARILGRKIDHSTEIAEYKEGKGNPYYLKKEIRMYYDNLILKKNI